MSELEKDNNPTKNCRLLKSNPDSKCRLSSSVCCKLEAAGFWRSRNENCEQWILESAVIEDCLNHLDVFFHVCKNLDVAQANQLAAIALMFLNQKFLLSLRYLVLAAQQHHRHHHELQSSERCWDNWASVKKKSPVLRKAQPPFVWLTLIKPKYQFQQKLYQKQVHQVLFIDTTVLMWRIK